MVLLRLIHIFYEFEYSIAPEPGQWAKLDKNIVVDAKAILRSLPQALEKLVKKLDLFNGELLGHHHVLPLVMWQQVSYVFL